MADISMCTDGNCPSRELCYRFTATPSEFRQSYGKFNREDDAHNCDMFWSNGVCKFCIQSNGVHKMSCPTMKTQVNMNEAKERAKNYMRLKDGYVDDYKYKPNPNPLLMDEIGRFPFIRNKDLSCTSKVTRVEVIQHSPPYNGRAFTNYNAKDVEIQLQDGGKTLKVFLK